MTTATDTDRIECESNGLLLYLSRFNQIRLRQDVS